MSDLYTATHDSNKYEAVKLSYPIFFNTNYHKKKSLVKAWLTWALLVACCQVDLLNWISFEKCSASGHAAITQIILKWNFIAPTFWCFFASTFFVLSCFFLFHFICFLHFALHLSFFAKYFFFSVWEVFLFDEAFYGCPLKEAHQANVVLFKVNGKSNKSLKCWKVISQIAYKTFKLTRMILHPFYV